MNKQPIALSEHFTFRKLIRFALPSILMMLFSSIYCIIDGFFISNFSGKLPFAAVNFIFPFLMILGAIGFMLGTGGSALIGKKLGIGDSEEAKKIFSMTIYCCIVFGIILTIVGEVLLEPVARWQGADEEMLPFCIAYGRIYLCGLIAYMLQMAFQSLLVTAEKPKMGLYVTLIAGISNMVLDALFIGVFRWGVQGAAMATVIGMFLGGGIPLIYFSRKNSSLLRLGKPSLNFRNLAQVFLNGSSEFVSQVAMSVVGIAYNMQLRKYGGNDAVASYGVLMYVGMIFTAIFIGFSVGTSPIVSYHYGADHKEEMRGLLKKGLLFICVSSISMVVLAETLAFPIAYIFLSYDQELMHLTVHAFRIYALAFAFCGFTIYASSFFTALNDGITSAAISFLRTLVFQIAAVYIFPIFMKLDGVWASLVFAELTAVIIAFSCFLIRRKKYLYF